jgi:hypothetical protein
MPIDATGIQLKLTRANEHLGTLTDAAGRWVNEEFRHTETEVVRGEHQWAVYRWAQMSEPDPMWGVYLGDFVHNVRSALDQIVWLCVLANGGSPGKHTQFPFLQSEKEWTEKITSRTDGYLPPTNGVSPQVLAVIMGAQPFQFSGKERSGHPFVRLLRMSNVDKHRTLHVAKVLAGPLSISYSPEGIIKIVNLKQARTASVVRPISAPGDRMARQARPESAGTHQRRRRARISRAWQRAADRCSETPQHDPGEYARRG